MTRVPDDLRGGEAVASAITNDEWMRYLKDDTLPTPSAAEAGGTLARIAAAHDLTFFAHYSTDTAGHRGGIDGATQAVERVDEFLGGIAGGLQPNTDLLVCSDHGNVEDARTGHTLNPSLGLLVGAGAIEFDPSTLTSLTEIPRFVFDTLGIDPLRDGDAHSAE